jgi:hypothetical protein
VKREFDCQAARDHGRLLLLVSGRETTAPSALHTTGRSQCTRVYCGWFLASGSEGRDEPATDSGLALRRREDGNAVQWATVQ